MSYINCPTCGGTGYLRPDGTQYDSQRQAAQARRRAVGAAKAARTCPGCSGVGAVRR